jgi:hypothetical protein
MTTAQQTALHTLGACRDPATEYSWVTSTPPGVSRSCTALSTESRAVTLRNRYAANTPSSGSSRPHSPFSSASSSARPWTKPTPTGQRFSAAWASIWAEASTPTSSNG